jgi:hypothetical protein
LPVAVKQGINHIDYVETLLASMQLVVQDIEQMGGMATREQVIGLKNMAQHIEEHIAIIAPGRERETARKAVWRRAGQVA